MKFIDEESIEPFGGVQLFVDQVLYSGTPTLAAASRYRRAEKHIADKLDRGSARSPVR